ncbi:probable serine/threonine-protein kinase kinX isoform X1 [Scylla paramamosain]|uniref:probable serine/threonine-protein kinase kinX isoform X1 n=1 Tax=Scylla paramamosain TaxID=85552 RepID=UPI003082E7A0
MSKFLPMFKKKGKGKEEDVIEETKKKRSKSHKLTKEILSSPSPSAVSKTEKKRKTPKRKAPLPQGKENYPSVEELEKEFFIDDKGIVRECPSELYVDASGVVREGPRELFIDKALTLEDSNPETVSDTSHEDCSLANEKQENGSPQSNEKNKDIEGLPTKNYTFGSDNSHETSFEDPEHESLLKNKKNSEDEKSDGDGGEKTVSSEKNGDECVVTLRSFKETAANESSLNAKLASRLSMSEELQYWQEEEAVILECETVTDSIEDIQKEPEVDNKVLENVHEVVDVNESVNAPLVSAPDIADDHVTVKAEENAEAEAEVEIAEERALSVAHEDSLVETFYTNTADSDDDFDSAKEDWDDEDSDEKESKENQSNSQLKEDFELSNGSEGLTEAENIEMRDRYEGQCSRHASTTSSVYQDAPSRENSLFDIDSIIEATNDGQGSVEGNLTESSQPNRLTRKVSNVSACSSDIFNEELDDLLNEELDRLSEEETSAANLQSSVDEGASKVSKEESSPQSQHQMVTQQNLPEVPHSENSEVATAVEQEIVKGISSENESKNASERPNEESIDDIITSTPGENESDGCTTSQEDKSSEHNAAEESVTGRTAQTSEGLDQAKDSGYYSLPMSPKPNTVTVSEREQAASAEPSVPQDSLKDSGEEDRPVPTAEMTVSTSVLETPEVQKSLLEDSVPDQTDASVPAELSLSCAAPEEGEEVPSVIEVNESTALVEDKSEENSEMPQKVDEKKRPTLERFKTPPPDLKGTASSPGLGGPVPGRHPRYKSPGFGCEGGRHGDEKILSPDPVGDMFLQQAVCMSHEEAEARLAQRRAARAEARELRLRELERQQHEQENDEEKQFASPSYSDDDDCEDDECDEEEEPLSRTGLGRAAARSSGMNCSGQYSRRSSEDSTTDEAALPANVREMRAELKELDEKFRKAMITNAQLDNEKATLTFEVELMKDRYTELEEAHTQLTKEHRKKCTEYEQLRKVSTKLQEEVKILRSMLQERDQLIQEYGLVVMGEEENGDDTDHIEEDDDVDDLSPRKLSVKKVLVSQEAAELLSKGAAKGSLDVRLRKFGEEKNDLEDQVRRLKLELEEERNKNRRRENGLDYEKQKEQSKTVNEYKFRVQKAEAEVSTLQANVVRLDAPLNSILKPSQKSWNQVKRN